METVAKQMIVNSADSHVLEPKELWIEQLPKSMQSRAPRGVIEGEREGDRCQRVIVPFGEV